LITPLLQEITSIYPECKIDLFVKGNLGPTIFKNYSNVKSIIQLPQKPFRNLTGYLQSWISLRKRHYDIAISAAEGSSSGRLSVQFARSKFKIFGNVSGDIQSKFGDYEHHAKFPVYNLRNFLTPFGIIHHDKPIPSLNLKLTIGEIAEGKKKLRHLVGNENKTVCLFTYATGDKCYTETWWEDFYARLKKEYPHYNIVEVLPIQNISKLSFKTPTFYSRDIRQIGSLIANAEIFIGADSGMMHLASASQTTTIGLFSVTDQTRYSPYDHNSLAINTNVTDAGNCFQIIRSIIDNLKYDHGARIGE
jgi:ADP-heptose:LPS heptosyltransferase